jgi:hypothetical protein
MGSGAEGTDGEHGDAVGSAVGEPVEVMTPSAAGGPALLWSTFSAKERREAAALSMAVGFIFTSNAPHRPSGKVTTTSTSF